MILLIYFGLVLYTIGIHFESAWFIVAPSALFILADLRYKQLKDRVSQLERRGEDNDHRSNEGGNH